MRMWKSPMKLMLSDSAENTAQTIQADIDANRPQS